MMLIFEQMAVELFLFGLIDYIRVYMIPLLGIDTSGIKSNDILICHLWNNLPN
jgi:hypothetical protein